MLRFVGLGLDQSPSLRAIELLKSCERRFFESYTSPRINDTLVPELSKTIGGDIETVSREFVEDGRKILDLARNENVALICSGDPMIATTHQDLRARALKLGISTQIIHGSSILCAVGGELGLSAYSFGKTVTMTRSPMQYTAYHTIFENLLRGLHTTLLFEWDESSGFFLSPKDAIKSLVEAENDLKYGLISGEMLLFSVSRIGEAEDKVRRIACTLAEAEGCDYGAPPITLVIPGRLHFTEVESLSVIFEKPENFFQDNSRKIERAGHRMVDKYFKKTMLALEHARSSAKEQNPISNPKKFDSVFENVELYAQDALRFMNEGKDELAVLSIGYAEGLLDSLRFIGELEFEW